MSGAPQHLGDEFVANVCEPDASSQHRGMIAAAFDAGWDARHERREPVRLLERDLRNARARTAHLEHRLAARDTDRVWPIASLLNRALYSAHLATVALKYYADELNWVYTSSATMAYPSMRKAVAFDTARDTLNEMARLDSEVRS